MFGFCMFQYHGLLSFFFFSKDSIETLLKGYVVTSVTASRGTVKAIANSLKPANTLMSTLYLDLYYRLCGKLEKNACLKEAHCLVAP